MDKLVTVSKKRQIWEYWRPIPKVWVPFFSGLSALIAWWIISGEWDREQTAGLVTLFFAAFFGYALPSNQPVIEYENSDDAFDRERAFKDQMRIDGPGREGFEE